MHVGAVCDECRNGTLGPQGKAVGGVDTSVVGNDSLLEEWHGFCPIPVSVLCLCKLRISGI